MKSLITVCILAFALSTNAQMEVFEKVDRIIQSQVKDNDPGIMLGIVQKGEIVYEKYHGLANLQHQVKASEKTRSNIASTAKQFTALMILDLYLDGKFSLEDDIRQYLPDFYPAVKEPIRIRHLINHSSGIRDYVELMSLQNRTWWRQVGLDNNDVMALIQLQEDLGFVPGTQYSYSNSGYVILTKIIEAATAQTFNDYSKAFFKKLGMNETAFIERYMGVIPNRANPYSDWGSGEWFDTPTVTKTNGEGFLFTTLKDQLLFEQLIQKELKDKDSLLAQSQRPIPNSEIDTYGFGLKLQNRLNRKAVHHDGVTYGYHAQTVRYPEEELSIFIMSNHGNIRSDLIADEIASLFLPKIAPPAQYDPLFYESMKQTLRHQIVGQYYSPSGYLTRIEEDDGKIMFKQGLSLSIEMIPEGKNTFYLSYDEKTKIVFYRNEFVIFEPSGETRVYARSAALPAQQKDFKVYVGNYSNNELDISFNLVLNGENRLLLNLSNTDSQLEVTAFNRNELFVENGFVLKIVRNSLDEVSDIRLSYNRAKNIRFVKNISSDETS